MARQRIQLTPAAVISAALGLAMMTLLVHQFLSSNSVRTAPLQPVALLPPPPPAQEMNKPPEEEPQEVSTAQDLGMSDSLTADASQAAPTSGDNNLGLDEAGGAGGDAFGLVGKVGGRELLLTAGGGSSAGNSTARLQQFAAQLQSYLREELNRVPEIRQACYTIHVALRLSPTGSLENVVIRKSTGSRALDGQISAALVDLPPVPSLPPPDMPWPVTLEIRSHRADCHP